jgi:hypothetical protein
MYGGCSVRGNHHGRRSVDDTEAGPDLSAGRAEWRLVVGFLHTYIHLAGMRDS